MINKKYLPIKFHYFFFMASVSPILPFLMVVAKQLGVPIIVQGTVGAIILVVTVFLKPCIAVLADTFPNFRKPIFVLIVALMVSSYTGISLLKPMHGNINIVINGTLYSSSTMLQRQNQTILDVSKFSENQSDFFLLTETASCYPNEAWDCYSNSQNSSSESNTPIINVKKMSIAGNYPQNTYILEGNNLSVSHYNSEISFTCEGALYAGDGCGSLFTNYMFLIYIILFLVGQFMFATANSISDAVCMDSIGVNGDYGSQRAWGTVGWGLMGPVSGFLVDWISRDKLGKDYSPAFLILFIFGVIDLFIIIASLKVPKLDEKVNVWESVGLLLKKPGFVVFLLFVILAGSFDGIILSYIFVLQEEMANERNLDYMQNMKLIQGLTLFSQCFFEAPFMWMCNWFLTKMRPTTLMSVVFFLYIIRLFGLATAGTYGPIWSTLLVELLNGPCYGLGYTAIVVQAGLLTPSGTSATVQSVTNIAYESLGYAAASLLGGIFYTLLSAPGIYFVFGIISLVTFLLHLLATKMLQTLEIATEDNVALGDRSDVLLPCSNQIIKSPSATPTDNLLSNLGNKEVLSAEVERKKTEEECRKA